MVRPKNVLQGEFLHSRQHERCNLNNVTLRARHVSGSLNVIADGLSRRNQIQPTEWSLSAQIFKQISKIWESPQVDLFVTSLNTKRPLYVSDPRSSGLGGPEHPMEKPSRLCFSSHCPKPKVFRSLPKWNLSLVLE